MRMWINSPEPLGGDSVILEIAKPCAVSFTVWNCFEVREQVAKDFLVKKNRDDAAAGWV